MKILYISHLSTNIAAGMNWSVPASVKAQELIDDVLWINTTDVIMPHWNDVKAYRNLKDLGGKLSLGVLPEPFENPDVVVFEGIYFKEYLGFAKELYKKGIHYVIVPRGSMTYKAMHNHAWLKKWVAHKLYFNWFINHAWRIQYLTRQEADDSIEIFTTPYFVVPNGVNLPLVHKMSFDKDYVNALFIGRLDVFHKGLDLLLDAVTLDAEKLRKEHFSLSLYGPEKYDYKYISDEITKRQIGDFVKLYGEVAGAKKERIIVNSDLFVMTSRFEGHPMGLIEALAYGLPSLVTPGTNMLQEIKESDAGWTCEGSVDEIRDALQLAISQRKDFIRKSRNAMKLSSIYDWNVLAQSFHDCIMQGLK